MKTETPVRYADRMEEGLAQRYFWCWFALTALLLAIASITIGQVQFGGYDTSLLIDSGWRLQQGQLPYRDFVTMLPPSFYLSSFLALKLFGDHWSSFVIANSCLFLLSALLAAHVSIALRQSLSAEFRHRLLLLYLIAVAAPLLVTNHLWHGSFASTLDTLLLLLWAYTASACTLTKRLSLTALFYLAVTTGLILLSKPNLAAVGLASSLAFVILSGNRAKLFAAWLVVLMGGACLAVLILHAWSISPAILFKSYAEVSGRPAWWKLLTHGVLFERSKPIALFTLAAYAIIATLGAGGFLLIRRERTSISRIGMAAALSGLTTSIIGFATDWDVKFNDLPAACFGLSVLLVSADITHPTLRRHVMRLCSGALVFMILCDGVFGVARLRMRCVGPWALREDGHLSLRRDPFFQTFYGSAEFWDVLDESDHALALWSHARPFFGPRLEFLYDRDKLPSPLHMPIWWHPGSSFPISRQDEVADTWHKERFDLVIFAPKRDGGYDRIPAAILSDLKLNYKQLSPANAALDVYVSKME